jgi:hypothetical protein
MMPLSLKGSKMHKELIVKAFILSDFFVSWWLCGANNFSHNQMVLENGTQSVIIKKARKS